jgi:hypothetical protein
LPGGSRGLGDVYKRQEDGHFRCGGQGGHACVAVFGGAAAVDRGFNQRVPRIAARAFAQPLGSNAATVGAGVLGFFFGHTPILLDK